MSTEGAGTTAPTRVSGARHGSTAERGAPANGVRATSMRSVAAAGGRFLARGNAAKAYESGVAQRVVVIEFDSVEQAVAAHDSTGYQAALKVFGKAADRDLRIVEGLA